MLPDREVGHIYSATPAESTVIHMAKTIFMSQNKDLASTDTFWSTTVSGANLLEGTKPAKRLASLFRGFRT